MSRVSALYRLQRIDSELDQHRARLAEIDRSLASSPAVQQAQADVAAAQASLAAARRRLKTLDDENQALTAKLAEMEERLYSGRVRNPRELQDVQAEVESLKRRRGALDEEQLAAMEVVDDRVVAEGAARSALAAAEAARGEEQRELQLEKESVEARVATLGGEREAAVSSVLAEDLPSYQALRKSKRGLAVALLVDGACSACGVAPSSSRIQAARQPDAGHLVRCGNCERILYADQGTGYTDTASRDDETITRW